MLLLKRPLRAGRRACSAYASRQPGNASLWHAAALKGTTSDEDDENPTVGDNIDPFWRLQRRTVTATNERAIVYIAEAATIPEVLAALGDPSDRGIAPVCAATLRLVRIMRDCAPQKFNMKLVARLLTDLSAKLKYSGELFGKVALVRLASSMTSLVFLCGYMKELTEVFDSLADTIVEEDVFAVNPSTVSLFVISSLQFRTTPPTAALNLLWEKVLTSFRAGSRSWHGIHHPLKPRVYAAVFQHLVVNNRAQEAEVLAFARLFATTGASDSTMGQIGQMMRALHQARYAQIRCDALKRTTAVLVEELTIRGPKESGWTPRLLAGTVQAAFVFRVLSEPLVHTITEVVTQTAWAGVSGSHAQSIVQPLYRLTYVCGCAHLMMRSLSKHLGQEDLHNYNPYELLSCLTALATAQVVNHSLFTKASNQLLETSAYPKIPPQFLIAYGVAGYTDSPAWKTMLRSALMAAETGSLCNTSGQAICWRNWIFALIAAMRMGWTSGVVPTPAFRKLEDVFVARRAETLFRVSDLTDFLHLFVDASYTPSRFVAQLGKHLEQQAEPLTNQEVYNLREKLSALGLLQEHSSALLKPRSNDFEFSQAGLKAGVGYGNRPSHTDSYMDSFEQTDAMAATIPGI